MSDMKTRPTEANVSEFLESIENERRKLDAYVLLGLLEELTSEKPVLWGPSIIGFGSYHYKYASGREGDWFRVGFSPRKRAFTVYIRPTVEHYNHMLKDLGKHRTGKGCLYINKLEDVDIGVLEKILLESLQYEI